MARFYALAVQPTLFGEVSLVRAWGRIGTRGQQMVHLFDNEGEAVSLFLDVLREKRGGAISRNELWTFNGSEPCRHHQR
ncbi:WGR domain-containing protein [Neorhizobium sp. 2083]|uniref:WGR domain-containing protein n=1 Tax=Neorhizobium sp. 2083 TaxID=2817762 RepID=UPI00286BCBD0|nr:WGR domain-containing protein [Neorhizobium sp. 2083]